MQNPKETSLVEKHRQAGARLVDFAGFLMPLSYSGIVDEHRSVREAAGLFDVSHMGEFELLGEKAIEQANRLVCNNVLGLADGQALYSPICRPNGGIVDDCLVYRLTSTHVRVVVNAANIEKDFAWFKEHVAGCELVDDSDRWALLALQGPKAASIWRELAGEAAASIAAFSLSQARVGDVVCTAARTGYTGEDGFEIFCAPDAAPALWDAIVAAGTPHGLKPCGLGCRDTLRLEARFPLYGNDITDETSPLEAGLGWTVKLKSGGDFIGREALVAQKRAGIARKLVCLEMRSRGIARHGHTLHLVKAGESGSLGETIGTVTSGTKSPTLGKAIALGYVPKEHSKPETELVVDVRGKAVAAEVVKGPFYQRPR
jgi:aminomethyltransferase